MLFKISNLGTAAFPFMSRLDNNRRRLGQGNKLSNFIFSGKDSNKTANELNEKLSENRPHFVEVSHSEAKSEDIWKTEWNTVLFYILCTAFYVTSFVLFLYLFMQNLPCVKDKHELHEEEKQHWKLLSTIANIFLWMPVFIYLFVILWCVLTALVRSKLCVRQAA